MFVLLSLLFHLEILLTFFPHPRLATFFSCYSSVLSGYSIFLGFVKLPPFIVVLRLDLTSDSVFLSSQSSRRHYGFGLLLDPTPESSALSSLRPQLLLELLVLAWLVASPLRFLRVLAANLTFSLSPSPFLQVSTSKLPLYGLWPSSLRSQDGCRSSRKGRSKSLLAGFTARTSPGLSVSSPLLSFFLGSNLYSLSHFSFIGRLHDRLYSLGRHQQDLPSSRSGRSRRYGRVWNLRRRRRSSRHRKGLCR